MNFRFLPEAEKEYEEAFDNHLAIDSDLAVHFVAEVETAIANIYRTILALISQSRNPARWKDRQP